MYMVFKQHKRLNTSDKIKEDVLKDILFYFD